MDEISSSRVKFQNWRHTWGDYENNMLFYFVQIAPHSYDSNNSNKIIRPLLAESQRKSLDLIPNSKMATTTDLASEVCIHPAEKRELANRIALLDLVIFTRWESMKLNFLKLRV